MSKPATIIDVCIVISVALILFAGSIERAADQCRERAISINAHYKWHPATGCVIKPKPQWAPLL